MRLRLTFLLEFVALSLNAASITTNIYSVGGFSTNDYRSLTTWEAGRQANLTTGSGTCEFVQCFATNDAYALTISGWTTATNNFIRIYAASGNGHSGKFDSTKFTVTAGDNNVIYVVEDYVTFEGLQVVKSSSASSGQAPIQAANLTYAANFITIDRCIVVQAGNASYNEPAIYINSSVANVGIKNCIVYGSGAASSANNAAVFINASSNCFVYSTTILDGYCGIRVGTGGGTVLAKNCYAGRTGSADYSGTITLTTCASEDSTGTVGLTGIAPSTSTFVNVSAGSHDYHLVSGSGLINVGTDTSGDGSPLNFTTDIDGQTRTGTWDIGADEYVSTSTKPTTTYLLKGLLR